MKDYDKPNSYEEAVDIASDIENSISFKIIGAGAATIGCASTFCFFASEGMPIIKTVSAITGSLSFGTAYLMSLCSNNFDNEIAIQRHTRTTVNLSADFFEKNGIHEVKQPEDPTVVNGYTDIEYSVIQEPAPPSNG